MKKIALLFDDDGKDMHIPIETVEYIEIQYAVWFMQLAIWLTIAIIVKILVFSIQYFTIQYLGYISFFALYFMNPYPSVKLIFVMCIIPTILNMFVFWILDNIV